MIQHSLLLPETATAQYHPGQLRLTLLAAAIVIAPPAHVQSSTATAAEAAPPQGERQ
jgi:hypothetical protein